MTAPVDRLPRLLALLPYLLAHPDSRVADVADVFGVTEEQLREDLTLLWMCGLPGYGPGDLIDLAWSDDGTVSVTHDAGMSRPLRLTTQEALALTVALRTLADVPGLVDASGRDGAPGDGVSAVERALVKLQAATGSAAGVTGQVAVAVESSERTLAALRAALDTGRALEMTYYTASRDETSRRVVDPMRLVLVEGRTYLEGWSRRSDGVRLFRTDRIDDIMILEEPARTPAHAEHIDVRGGVFRASAEHTQVVLDLTPAARWVADYYPVEAVTDNPDGSTRVTLRAADESWARRLVLSLGTAVRVIAPEHLGEQVRVLARQALAAYDDTPSQV